jgi:riboflavin kinase/FMN adenylyltransferase
MPQRNLFRESPLGIYLTLGEEVVLVEEELTRFSPGKDTLLTVGVFDGVHLGHKHLLSKLLEQARQKDLLSGVVTFHQYPEDLFASPTKLPFLTDMEARISLLKKEGVDIVVPLSFTTELAQLGARQFVGLLQKYLRMRGLVIGPDFALGRGREGDAATLQRLGQDMNFSVMVVPPLEINGEIVSSTAIRKSLADGNMKKIRQLSGSSFSLRGKVVSGTGRGEDLGFPTANLDISPGQALPPDGVYASWAHIDGKVYHSMTNIGQCPTFGDCERTVEAHLVDYSGDIYGRELKIDLVDRLRDEKKFASADELKAQVAEDIKQGKTILESIGAN